MLKSMDTLVALCKNRGIIYPGSEIYGGLANSWDYGPIGAELKKNIKEKAKNRFTPIHMDTAIDILGKHLPEIEDKKVTEKLENNQLDFNSDIEMKLPKKKIDYSFKNIYGESYKINK